jgi:hypothetical protein
MPKTDATELAPKKSAYNLETLRHTSSVLEGFWFLPQADQRFLKSAHFFGEVPERRSWAITCEDRPAAFAGRSKSRLSSPCGIGIPPLPIQASILSPRIIYRPLQLATPTGNLRNQPEIIVKTVGATTAVHYT